MNCENCYCIYQHKGKCILKDIQIDIAGMCTECIYVDLDAPALTKAKIKLLKAYNGNKT